MILSVVYHPCVPLKIGQIYNCNNLFVSADKVFYQIKWQIKSDRYRVESKGFWTFSIENRIDRTDMYMNQAKIK